MRHRGKKDKKILPSMVGATGFEPVILSCRCRFIFYILISYLFILQKVKFLHPHRTELQLFDHQV